MILHCSFEEVSAVGASAERVLASAGSGGVAAPPEILSHIETAAATLTGDVAVGSLHTLQSIIDGIEFLAQDSSARTDGFILEHGPSGESTIVSFFEYAHLLNLLDRARRMGDQMRALIELMTGQPVTQESARRFAFPD